MIRSATLVAIGGLAALSSIEAVAADPLPTETFKVLPATLAVEAAEAAIASCKGQGYNISVTIVDRAGNLKSFLATNIERRGVIPPMSAPSTSSPHLRGDMRPAFQMRALMR
jgi:hypothetical protein